MNYNLFHSSPSALLNETHSYLMTYFWRYTLSSHWRTETASISTWSWNIYWNYVQYERECTNLHTFSTEASGVYILHSSLTIYFNLWNIRKYVITIYNSSTTEDVWWINYVSHVIMLNFRKQTYGCQLRYINTYRWNNCEVKKKYDIRID